jgi:hypothetical protein
LIDGPEGFQFPEFAREIETDAELAKALRTSFYKESFSYERCQKCDHGCMAYAGGPRISSCDKPTTTINVNGTDYSTVEGLEELFGRVYRMEWWEEFWEDKGPIGFNPKKFRQAVIDFINENFTAHQEVCIFHDKHCNVKCKTTAEDILTFE